MAGTKTDFQDRTIVTPEFLDTIYKTNGGHNHKGLDEDGSANKLDIATETTGTIPITRVPQHDHKATPEDPASYPKLDIGKETIGILPANRTVFPIGGAIMYAGYDLGEGDEVWMFCYGQEISRTEYPECFKRLNYGMIHGEGDGSTTFNLPDSRNLFPVGAAAFGSGSGYYHVGQQGGAVSITLQEKHIPPHKHKITGNDLEGNNTGQSFRRTTGDVESNGETESWGGESGAAVPIDNRPPFLGWNFIIRVK